MFSDEAVGGLQESRKQADRQTVSDEHSLDSMLVDWKVRFEVY
jgi:hypothetical protein